MGVGTQGRVLDPSIRRTVDRSRQYLNTARMALDNGDPESAASRAYYSLYHMTILLLRVVRGIERERWDHEQLHREFLDHFCRLGYLFGRQDGEDWDYVKNSRLEADYGESPLPPARARRAVERSRRLANDMENRLRTHDQTR